MSCRGCCGSSSGSMGTLLLASEQELVVAADSIFEFDTWDWAAMGRTEQDQEGETVELGNCRFCSGPAGIAILAQVTGGNLSAVLEIWDCFDAAGLARVNVESIYITDDGIAVYHVPHGRAVQVIVRNPYAAGTVTLAMSILATSPVVNVASLGRFAPRTHFFDSGNVTPGIGVVVSSDVYHVRSSTPATGAPGAGVKVVTIDKPLIDWTAVFGTASAGALVAIDGASDASMAGAVRLFSRATVTAGTWGSQVANTLAVPAGGNPQGGSPVRVPFAYIQVHMVNGGTAQASGRLAVVGGHE